MNNSNEILPGYQISNNSFNYYIPHYGDDPVLDCIRTNGIFEPEVIQACASYILPNTDVIDLGGNYGQMALHFSKLNQGGTVHCVEASEFVFRYLEKTISINPECNNIKLYYAAAWDESNRDIKMNIATGQGDNYHSGASVRPAESPLFDHMDYHLVKTLAVDDMVLDNKVSLIKIDVQCSDLFALRGAKNTIMTHKPVVIFEYETAYNHIFGYTWEDYVNFLQQVNYKIVASVANNNHDFICVSNEI